EIPCPTASHSEIVLNERIERRGANTVGDRKPCLGRRGDGRCSEEGRKRWKSNKSAGPCVEVVIAEPSEFGAKVQRRSATNPRDGLVVLERRGTTPLRESIDTTKTHHTGHINVRKN